MATIRSNSAPSGSVPGEEADPVGEAERSALARATSSAAAEVSVAVTSQPGSSSAIASATAPEPVPTSRTVRGRQLERQLDQQLGLRPRHQDPRVDRELDRAEAPAAEDVGDRLAPQPPPHHLAEAPAPAGGRDAAPGVGGERRPVPSGRLGQQQLGVEARASRRPAAASASTAASSASPTPPAVPAARHQAVEVAASRRCRFSSAASASVNSESSPARTPSRLWEVTLTRWSVTRPCGKL